MSIGCLYRSIRYSVFDKSKDDSADRFATLQAELGTPVSTVTPAFSQTPFTPTPQQPTSTPEKTDPLPSSSPTTLSTQTSTAVPPQLLPSPTTIYWIPSPTSQPYNPTQLPNIPVPTNPPPPPPTDPPPPPPTNPPPPPPPNPYPPAYP